MDPKLKACQRVARNPKYLFVASYVDFDVIDAADISGFSRAEIDKLVDMYPWVLISLDNKRKTYNNCYQVMKKATEGNYVLRLKYVPQGTEIKQCVI